MYNNKQEILLICKNEEEGSMKRAIKTPNLHYFKGPLFLHCDISHNAGAFYTTCIRQQTTEPHLFIDVWHVFIEKVEIFLILKIQLCYHIWKVKFGM